MSIDALRWAFRLDGLSCGAKFVLIALADFADEAGSCFPLVETIAARTAQGESTVKAHIKTLRDDGWLTVERERLADGSFGRNRYALSHQDEWGAPPEPKSRPGPGLKSRPTRSEIQTSKITPKVNPQLSLSNVTREAIFAAAGDALADPAKVPGIHQLTSLVGLLGDSTFCPQDIIDGAAAAAAWYRGKHGPGSMKNWDLARQMAIKSRDGRLAPVPLPPSPNAPGALTPHDPATNSPRVQRQREVVANYERALTAPTVAPFRSRQ